MDNKRKGSTPPRSPAGDDDLEWRAPVPHEPSPFEFQDDDDSPLPAPPDFDGGRREAVPELLEGDLSDDDVATAEELEAEEPELLDSSLVTEVRPTHRMPPPIPAPVPVGPGRSSFVDDGEIALPPRIAAAPQSFPFRQLQRDAFEADDEPTPDASGWRSAALRQGASPDEEEAEELEAEEAEEVPDEPHRPPPARPSTPPRPAFAFRDDDDDASLALPEEPDERPAPRVAVADTDADTPRRPAMSESSRYRDPARMFADSDADETLTTRADDDASSVLQTPGANPATGLFALPADDEPPAATDEAPVEDSETTQLYRPDEATASSGDWVMPRPPQPSAAIPVAAMDDDDDADWAVPSAPQPPPAADDPRWSSPGRGDGQPSVSGEIRDDERPTAGALVDDDEAPAPADAWSPPLRDDDEAPAPVTGDDDTWAAPTATPVTPADDDTWAAPGLSATPTDDETAATPTDDDETSATAASATWTTTPRVAAAASGEWGATPEPRPPALSGAIPVADHGDDDDDEWVPAPPAPPARAAEPPHPAEPSPARGDDDDEWEPQTAAVGLAPIPTDLGEAFPLDLWSDPDELIGRELGRWRLIKPLSRGQITRVYAGESLDGERAVAIRLLAPTYSPAEPRARQFLYEAQQLARLTSDHIVDVLDCGTTSDHLTYYVMELLDGDTLASVARTEGPLPWQDVAAFANQILDALVVAADQGVVHGDLTAASVLRLRPRADDPAPPEGERRRDRLKLLGVGITPLTSTFRNSENNPAQSQGTPPGTAEYMAPEIASGGRPDAHTEIYALGVLMYELVTGRPPFRGDSFLAVLKKQMYDEPTSPRLVVPEQDIPEAFEEVVLKALAKAPVDRHADLRALDAELLAVRAREGELRRVTQILALDPTDWDEEGSRKAAAAARPPSTPVRAAAEPVPLATFAADLKEHNPELAAKVFDRPPAKPAAPAPAPRPSIQLTQLAAPITAPPPAVQQIPGQIPVTVLVQPGADASPFNVRNISIVVITICLAILAFLAISDRGGRGKTRQDVAAEARRPAAPPKAKKTTPKPRPAPEAVAEPDPAPTPPAKKDPTPAVVPEPVKQPEPEPVKQPEPEPVKQPEPEPIKQPEPEPIKQPITKQPETKKPVEPRDPYDARPERIESSRLNSKLKAMEPRVRSACSAKSGLPNPKGLKVTIKVVISPKGTPNVTATGAWAGTPMGTCVEGFVEGMLNNLNESRSGGSVKYVVTF